MNVEKKDVEDLLSDESFINYCKLTSADDVAFWENIFRNNPGSRQLITTAKERFDFLFNALAAADMDEQTARLNYSISQVQPATIVKMDWYRKDKSGITRNRIIKIAAASAFIFAALFAFRYFRHPGGKTFKTITAAFGEKKNVQLPDGSEVTLNGGSKLKTDDGFGVQNRDIYLEGEAFFDVKHNEKVPFVVHTAAMDVKAVGTSFNVKAYTSEKITEASLIRGLVEVTLKENHNLKMLLYPNQKIKWEHQPGNAAKPEQLLSKNESTSAGTDSLMHKLINNSEGVIKEIAWKENKLVFDNEQFDDIAILLERWYGVQIHFNDSELRSFRFTGTFEKEDINTLLDFLKESRNFNYSVERGENTIINLTK